MPIGLKLLKIHKIDEEKSKAGKNAREEHRCSYLKGQRAESVLIRNCLKTASERPQSGPVTPLASNEVAPGPRSLLCLPILVQTGWNRVNTYVPRT